MTFGGKLSRSRSCRKNFAAYFEALPRSGARPLAESVCVVHEEALRSGDELADREAELVPQRVTDTDGLPERLALVECRVDALGDMLADWRAR